MTQKIPLSPPFTKGEAKITIAYCTLQVTLLASNLIFQQLYRQIQR